MTIEQKANAYNELFVKAKQIYNKENDVLILHTIEDLFPELAESEDERIRKDCIKYLDWEYQHCFINEDKIKIEKCIAWLEKQGEQNPTEEIEPTPIFRIGDVLKRKNKDYTFRVDRIQGGYYHCDRNHGAFFPIEEQDNWELVKQNHTDNKPKFKVGDWIVLSTSDGEKVVQIDSIEYFKSGEPRYITITSEGRWFGNGTNAHLWTIQDAKDGDVLVDEDSNIGIYKEIEGIYWNSRIYLGCDGKIRGFSIGGSHMQNNTKPATKEQHDLLFQKMKEAGYEWDAEKKELKEIIDEKQIKKNLQDNSFRRMFE